VLESLEKDYQSLCLTRGIVDNDRYQKMCEIDAMNIFKAYQDGRKGRQREGDADWIGLSKTLSNRAEGCDNLSLESESTKPKLINAIFSCYRHEFNIAIQVYWELLILFGAIDAEPGEPMPKRE